MTLLEDRIINEFGMQVGRVVDRDADTVELPAVPPMTQLIDDEDADDGLAMAMAVWN